MVPGPVGHRVHDLAQGGTGGFTATVEHGARDPSRGYANATRDELADAVAVPDAFHVVKLGTSVVHEVRRRTQQDTPPSPRAQGRSAVQDLRAAAAAVGAVTLARIWLPSVSRRGR